MLNHYYRLPVPNKIKYLVFSDLDETYLPWNPTAHDILSIKALEQFFLRHQQEVLFVWISGSIFGEILNKIEKNKFSILPQFIASSLGTELWHYDASSYLWKKNEEWEKSLNETDCFTTRRKKTLIDLAKYNICLTSQNVQKRWSQFKHSYYYFSTADEDKTKQDLNIIYQIAGNHDLNVNISRCNPKIDNYPNGYDIDFIPLKFGKNYTVNNFISKFKVPKENTFAFGDSSNDLSMLQTVHHGYLVENATLDAKLKHDKIAQRPYAEGILSVLTSFFNCS